MVQGDTSLVLQGVALGRLCLAGVDLEGQGPLGRNELEEEGQPAPEYLSRATRAYYAPVDDFELMVTTVVAADGRLPVPGRGPRILLAVEGAMTLVTQAGSQTLAQGEAVFVGADERGLSVEGEGTLVQADVP